MSGQWLGRAAACGPDNKDSKKKYTNEQYQAVVDREALYVQWVEFGASTNNFNMASHPQLIVSALSEFATKLKAMKREWQ